MRGSRPVELAEKEGLALINGTDGMLGMLLLALADLRTLLTTADITAALSVEGLLGTDAVFAADLQACARSRARPPRPPTCARCWPAARSSPATAVPRTRGCRTPIRCAAHRRWPAGRATRWPTPPRWPSASSASAIDNPVIVGGGDEVRVASNGNFHGAPLGYVLDFLAIVAADVASIAERRTDRFLDPARSHGLPAFLAA